MSDARDTDRVEKSREMRRADTANGENPDVEADEAPHPTGERQAKKNRENDPPA